VYEIYYIVTLFKLQRRRKKEEERRKKEEERRRKKERKRRLPLVDVLFTTATVSTIPFSLCTLRGLLPPTN
jgi:hypothetical protein